MKRVPEVLIIGRPNVGKSTLINRLLKSKKTITYDMPGVTRDLLTYPCEFSGKNFMLVDSGGVLFTNSAEINMQTEIERLVEGAIASADRIIFVVDGKEGVDPLDKVIAKILRPLQNKVLLAVNKLDSIETAAQSQQFYALGLGDPLAISAKQNSGLDDLMTVVTEPFKVGKAAGELYNSAYNIAIVGRPNVGKSSLVNAIMNEDRILVSDVAGTTRDSIDVYFNQGEHQYVFTDTAGLRKKARVKESVEFYSTVRSHKAIEEADLVVVVLDAHDFLMKQDKKIINEVLDAKKNMIIFINKWDLTLRSDQARKDLEVILKDEMPILEYFPMIFGSATEKMSLGKLFATIPTVISSGETRISTSELNQFVDRIFGKTPPPSKKGRRLKIYYSTQAERVPPVFILFVNDPGLVDPDYMRFLEKRFRSAFGGYIGNPVQLFLKGKEARGAKGDI